MKVAVIGGGFSGMLAAYLLEKEGIDVTIYEKEEYIGGHCKTIVSRGVYTELGTIFSFNGRIKELLIDLQVDYTERFIYRNFADENYDFVEHMLKENVPFLIDELAKLKVILDPYTPYLNETNFGYIPKELMMPLNKFLKKHNLKLISQIIDPHLSSFGFGSGDHTQAYYVFKAFNLDMLFSFIYGERFLSIDKGTSELIKKLSQKISDIRYSLEVNNVEMVGSKVRVETPYGTDCFDKVLITTKLPSGVIKDHLYDELMKKIDTNPFITCAYEVANKDLATTYCRAHLGQLGKIQLLFSSRQHSRTIITAYAYGRIEKDIIGGITKDLQQLGVHIKQLITVKQWFIFPHLKAHNLTQTFYQEINERQKISNIRLIGSLVSKPSLDNLYLSVKDSINDIIQERATSL